MLEPFDIKLIRGFLETNFDAFQAYLEENDLEGSGAEQIIEKLKGEG